MFSLCPIHSVARDVTVSKNISKALEGNVIIEGVVEVVIVMPDEHMAKEHLFVDLELLKTLGIEERSGIVLYDRDKTNKKMNDRLVINKLSGYLCSACPICLSEKLGLKSSI
ncbi:hypothetical protein AAEY27_10060 [Kosakonia sp. BYX6]|uniref:Uncharacterized protein n=1 Tax=Kosakonia calanthes TaxID=3139408 RepID=A0ABZ3BA36_9ENTR